jgi:hypothetical protein
MVHNVSFRKLFSVFAPSLVAPTIGRVIAFL